MADVATLATADWSGMIACATLCYPCQFDECPDVPHTWGGPEDFEHAWATFQNAPGYCGCECGRPARSTRVRVTCLSRMLRLWEWSCPGCKSGKAAGWSAALVAAGLHRAGADCRRWKAAP